MGKLEGFTEAKHRIVRAIDYRIQQLPLNGRSTNVEDRIEELQKLRQFVKGMVTEVNFKKKLELVSEEDNDRNGSD